MVLIKCTSNTLLLRMFTGALLMIVHVNLWISFSFKYLTGSDLLFLSLLQQMFQLKIFTVIKTLPSRHLIV